MLWANIDNIAMGITFVYQSTVTFGYGWSILSYGSLSLALNIILTFMIVIRLALHVRSTRKAMGVSGIGGLCNPIITMLVESCALYSVSLVLVLGPWVAGNGIFGFFLFILPQTQVRSSSRPRSSNRFSDLEDGSNRSSHHCSSFSESLTRAR